MKGIIVSVAVGAALVGGALFFSKYITYSVMKVDVEEVARADYPEDPAHRSVLYNAYAERHLKVAQKEGDLYDFILESDDPSVASITFQDVDLSLFVPVAPESARDGAGLEKIALIERQWNRQQVRFTRDSRHLLVHGGDGFEKKFLVEADLTKNCLNAGLWELHLFIEENGSNALYYQGWFNLPLGHYKQVFEKHNGRSYWSYWYSLEHWWDPQGTYTPLERLRTVVKEKTLPTSFNPDERIIAAGEQQRKVRTVNGKNMRRWKDINENSNLTFATFVPPGRYEVNKPWGNEFDRIHTFEKTIWREVAANNNTYDEVELQFRSTKGVLQRFIVSGINIHELPLVAINDYPSGLYMPMGIGVPPLNQNYEALKQSPPQRSPYFSLMLDEDDRWINHHAVAIDGPILHRDMRDQNKVHLYLMSYERHCLVRHFIIDTRGINNG